MLLLMDVQMPVVDGHEATQRIRAAHGSSIKIVAVRANVYPEDRQRALRADISFGLAGDEAARGVVRLPG